ncbi:MAG: hypothetical protein HZA77_09445 [Candidatus Schekmanbacteria bacterium]|nr:hypothetical protein [Candidatus Schekmanbacteria bacterium]
MFIPYQLNTDFRIEVHLFRPEDFTNDNFFGKEIIRCEIEGVKKYYFEECKI